MAAVSEKTTLRFRAGEVGFVFYEDAGFPGTVAGRTYAFGTIGEAATWLKQRFEAAPSSGSRPEAADGAERIELEDPQFVAAERMLFGRRWTPGQATRLRTLVSIGAAGAVPLDAE
jgi:hypothetical protein